MLTESFDMSIKCFWRLPTNTSENYAACSSGDNTRLDPNRFTFIDHVARVVRGAELVGFFGVLVPRGSAVDDVWSLTASLLRESRLLHFLTTFGAQFIEP